MHIDTESIVGGFMVVVSVALGLMLLTGIIVL
jgi:hypothetical protein